jgi:hypothetical protein
MVSPQKLPSASKSIRIRDVVTARGDAHAGLSEISHLYYPRQAEGGGGAGSLEEQRSGLRMHVPRLKFEN